MGKCIRLQHITFLRKTSFKEDVMILGHSSNGSVEMEEEALQADLEGPTFTLLSLQQNSGSGLSSDRLSLFEYNKGHGDKEDVGQRMKEKKQRLHHSYRRKTYRSEGSIEVWIASVGGRDSYTPPKRAKQFRIPKHILRGSVSKIKNDRGYRKDGDRGESSQFLRCVKASANSDVKYSFTSAQDGELLQDDVRLCLGNDLKKAQDHSQRHV
ncbi:hypothetical protein Tco_0458060 [Tanacetum coccineum]